jgi:methionyl-tRNA formyltransferase
MRVNPRIAFFGSPALAADCLREIDARFAVCLVVTRPDAARGRGRRVSSNPVGDYARERRLPLLQPQRLDEPFIEDYVSRAADLNVVVAYGKILPRRLIDRPPHGSVNLHASLLPRYRGPSPLEAAILAGDRETGLTVQLMKPELDAGDILAQLQIELTEDMDYRDLLSRVREESPAFLSAAVREFLSGAIQPVAQEESEATRCRIIRKSDGLIDWREPAVRIHNQIRAFVRWPVAYTDLDGRTVRILRARPCGCGGSGSRKPGLVIAADREGGIRVVTGKGCLCIVELQLENRKVMGIAEFLNGYRSDIVGKRLGGPEKDYESSV